MPRRRQLCPGIPWSALPAVYDPSNVRYVADATSYSMSAPAAVRQAAMSIRRRVFCGWIQRSLQLPRELEDHIRSFMDPTDRLDLEIYEQTLDPNSPAAIQRILWYFGYPPHVNVLEDHVRYHNLVRQDLQYVWCTNGRRTDQFIRQHRLQRVVIVGTLEHTQAPITRCPHLQYVDYILPWLTSLNSGCWMSECDQLTEVRFTGLGRLETVGHRWLQECRKLQSIQFRGLTRLQTIGSYWMARCDCLIHADFRGLDNLQTVGDHWLDTCTILTHISFVGTPRLRVVGSYWLSWCEQLTAPSWTGLASLQVVGDCWMSGCDSLVIASFHGLTSLGTVGHYWMAWCRTLLVPQFDDLTSLQRVGTSWMRGCNALVSPQFTGCTNLREVGAD